MRASAGAVWFFVVAITVSAGACGDGSAPKPTTGQVTFWGDVAPIYSAKCVACHQEGGIAPFRLDNYQDAKAHAALELVRTSEGTMPPYFMTHDGSCGSFHDEPTLSDAQKATIAAWVNGGTVEGTEVTIERPARPRLEGAVDIRTPVFTPRADPTDPLAEFDEYRCFVADAPTATDAFLTGYDVTPGTAAIVHHVLVYVVDPQAPAGGGRTNAEVMQTLDGDSPDRAGWPCFGGAGDGLDVNGLDVSWAPGQGVVNFPDGMGAPIRATDKLIIQVHYNLADPGSPGMSDTTAVHLRMAPRVDRQLVFLLPDPFLESIEKPTPDTLPPGKNPANYTWTRSGADLGVQGGISSVDLVAVMPHMHGRGMAQTLRLGPPGAMACAAKLDHWNFHWQEFYFYKTPLVITPETQIQVSCDYDTSHDVRPVLPGWGTRNEMCLAVMMVALPAQ